MSEPKKPGFKDIGDLRSKLGLAPDPAPVAAPPPEEEDDDDATQILGAVTDDQLAQMETAYATPAVAPAPAPGMAPQPAPAPGMAPQPAPAPGLAPQPAPTPDPQLPGAAPVSPLVPPPADATDGARLPDGGPYVSPSHDAIASAPPPALSQDGNIESPLAGALAPPPMTPGPLAAPPPDLMGANLAAGDATLAAFAPVQRTNRKIWGSAIVFAALLSLVFGYAVGDINKDRKIINRRIADCQRLAKPVKATVAKLKPVIKAIRAANPDKVDWDLAKQLGIYDGKLIIEEVITDNLLLGPTITGDLVTFIFNASQMYNLARKHGRLTLKRHKKFLEDFDKEAKALHSQKPMFVYHKGGKGAIVTVEGQPVKKGKKQIVNVRFLTGAEREATLDDLIAIDKREMIGATGPNVMELYAGRIRELRTIADELDKMYERLVSRLQKEAERDEVFAL